jgi:hypothetical protein
MHVPYAAFYLGLLLSVSAPALAATPCNQTQCGKGTKVITFGPQDDPYFACPTRELAEYMHFVLGLVNMHVQVTGQRPTLSPTTGEPQQNGETKAMIDGYRKAAGVPSFNAAASQCVKGPHGLRVSVDESPEGLALRVSDRSGRGFWMPKAYAER